MKQYQRGANPNLKTVDPGLKSSEADNTLAGLKAIVARQDAEIEKLQKSVRQLKTKLDKHADYINGKNRG